MVPLGPKQANDVPILVSRTSQIMQAQTLASADRASMTSPPSHMQGGP